MQDIAAAIDDATADGVDVINLSFSGSRSFIVDPVELAFMFSADAGGFVATSAGNSGPTASTVAHNSPWDTTVAASTNDRSFTKSMTLGNGTTFTGPAVGPAVPPSPLVYSANVGLPGVDATAVRLCFSDADSTTPGIQPALDPAKVAGKIVACDRGTNARVDKSLAVRAGGGDLLKPDITAPGVDVIEAVSPPGDNGNGYDAFSGTSMSSPHIAGIAALLIGKHPGWSPMAVKSALMMTASQTDNAGNPILGPDGASNATP
jgi:subtilisin family serine protease